MVFSVSPRRRALLRTALRDGAARFGTEGTITPRRGRLRIEHPDLPADLRNAAGELVATLWTRATTSAQAELDALRADMEGERAEAEQRVTAALLAAHVEVCELEKAQAAGHAARQAMEAEIPRL